MSEKKPGLSTAALRGVGPAKESPTKWKPHPQT